MSPHEFRTDRPSFAGADLLDGGERAPRIRTGPRDPISPLVRQLVYRRDQYRCQSCGAVPNARDPHRRSGALHLDHIIPWSAGGPDRSDNLRTLCGPCNEKRSNFVTGKEKPSTPIVRICLPCLTNAYARPDGAFDVYCACRHHPSWALPGWHIL